MSASSVGDKTWLGVIDLGSVSAVDTLAVAYGVATRLGPEGNPILVLAEPNGPFLCAGANEDVERRIDLSFCREQGIPSCVAGSAARHPIDRDQLIFHVIVPLSKAPRPAAQ
jgi:lipoate-protein ligase A